jgi:carotenoid cleavage dioxygenase
MTALDDITPAHLRGNGRPVTEELTLTSLPVKGSIPAELDGRYMRNGANPITGMSDHAFFGDGMVHGVRLRGGTIEWYRNRYVRTPFYANPTLDILDPSVLMDPTASKANTNVIGHAGKILALEEGHYPYQLDGNLDTVGAVDFEQGLKGSFTAHPKICPVTGELLAFGYGAFEPYLRYVRVAADCTLAQDVPITVGGPTMMHDFNITRNYVIFMDLPAVFDLDLAMAGEMPIHWSDTYPARLGVMPRNGTDADVRWFDLDPCYVFHPMNAYEDGTSIIIDVARLDHIWRESMFDFPPPMLWRWTIDTVTGAVHQRQLDDRPAEFPRVADSKVGLQHRFGYMAAAEFTDLEEASLRDGTLLKYDLETGQRSDLNLGRGSMPGEPVFVAAEGGVDEDDGYLMTFVYDSDRDASRFVVLDAKTMDPEPIASVDLPRIPFGFHGNWVSTAVAD